MGSTDYPSAPLATPPFVIIIFGGNGDLSRRKLLPSLYNLEADGFIHEDAKIIAASRNPLTDKKFKGQIKAHLANQLGKSKFSEETWNRFSQKLHYLSLDAVNIENFHELQQLLKSISAPKMDIVHYLATAPNLFGLICHNLAEVGLNDYNARVVVEKPIGNNLASSKKINDEVAKYFKENQTFRIDHYLGKETVQNLLAIRFANSLFEPLWDHKGIDHVQITVAETIGIEDREAYYSETGALKDMVQNHILQLLCLVAMEPPTNLDANSVRDEKLKVLKSLRPIIGKDIREHTVRGYYTSGSVEGHNVKGYKELMAQFDRSAELESTEEKKYGYAETFVALKANIDNWRWEGVPFYLRTGKRLPKRYSEIVIFFKSIPHSIFSQAKGELEPNKLVIRLQPEETIELYITNKVPSLTPGVMKLRSAPLNLSLSRAFDSKRTIDAYERLLLDVINNTATLFMRRDEVEAAWQWIDTITAGWEQFHYNCNSYAAGTWGPTSSIALPLKEGRCWYE